MKLARIKSDYAGKACLLSNDVFVWVKGADEYWVKHYPDSMFQLISGVGGSTNPGYHRTKGWVTICAVEKNPAQFLGVKLSSLKKLSQKQRLKRGINEAPRNHENSRRFGSGSQRCVVGR